MNLEINNLNANNILSKLNEDNIEIYLDVFKVLLKIKKTTQILNIITFLESGNNSMDKIIFFQMISKIIINKNGRNLVTEIAKLLQPIIPIIQDKLLKEKSKRGKNRMNLSNKLSLKYIIRYLDNDESYIIKNLKQKIEKLKLIHMILFSNEYQYQINVRQKLVDKKINRNIDKFQRHANVFSKILEDNNNNNNSFENISRDSLIIKILEYYKKIFPANRQNIFSNKLQSLEKMTYEELFQLANSINLNKERNKKRIKKNMKIIKEEENIQSIFNELNISTRTA